MASGTKKLSAWETLRDLESADISAATVPDTKSLLGSVGLVRSRLDRLEAAVNTRIDEHHRAGDSEDSESANRRSGKSRRSSKKAAQRSTTLEKSPTLADSLDSGDITSDHIDVVSNKLTDLDPDKQQRLLDHIDDLFGPSLDPTDDPDPVPTPEKLRDDLTRYLDLLDEQAGIDKLEKQQRSTKLRKWVDPHDGMYKFFGELDPLLGEAFFKNIDDELEALWRQQHPKFDGKPLPQGLATNQHLAAHGLANLATKGRTVRDDSDETDSGTKANPGRRNTTDLIVLIDFETIRDGLRRHSICETGNGTGINTATARRLACEAGIIPAVLDTTGELLDLGRRQRLATPAQRRALRILHPTCAFGTCGTAFNHCHIHHVIPWEHGGPTDLVNLLPLCHKHHHLVHEGNWQLKLLPDRTVKIYRPNGEHSETVPPPTAEQTQARNANRERRKPNNN